MVSKSDIFVQECVLSFGFLGGLFTWAGIDPEEEIIKTLLRVAFPNNEPMVMLAIVLFIVGSTVAGVLLTYQMAGKWGLFVVGMAWISGFALPMGESFSVLGTFLLIGALILGPIVCDSHTK